MLNIYIIMYIVLNIHIKHSFVTYGYSSDAY